MSKWGALHHDIWHHNLIKHSIVFQSVVVITQLEIEKKLEIENGKPLFDVSEYNTNESILTEVGK